MPFRVAMPIAHITGAVDYAAYYAAGSCFIRVVEYFNLNGCEGIRLESDPAAPAETADSIWDLYAFTDGFLSLQGNNLVLRLPRELTSTPARKVYNSGKKFPLLRPHGPHLRHLIYSFDAAPGAAVSDKLRAILQVTTHPGRNITQINVAGAAHPLTLQQYLAADPAHLEELVVEFMAGRKELFVRAGDAIGNFRTGRVELRFLDSCGELTTTPSVPGGRPLNPAYFMYLIRSATNAANVTMLTALVPAAPNPPTTTHPLYFVLDPQHIIDAGREPSIGVDLAATEPPLPRHITVVVQDAAHAPIALFGIPMRGLGEWHESRNAANPFSTGAPVRWRLYGNQAADVNSDDYGKFITEVKTGSANRLPGPGVFDHQFTPDPLVHTIKFQSYWSRYCNIFNLAAATFEVPVELMIAIACSETSTGYWYNAAFANTHEMDIIRMEPLSRLPASISPNAAQQLILTNYMNLTGGVSGGGGNANLPVPWSGALAVHAPNPLTWGELRGLIPSYPNDVKVSPGIMQALVGTALGDLTWGRAFYGAGYVHALSINHNGVALIADAPPATRDALFSDWYAVAVDAAGANTVVSANVDAELTKMKRALHNIIAGAMHIKRQYNTIIGADRNIVTDFDLPTSFSGYNDGAGRAAAATAVSTNPLKWKKLFALIFYDENYPKNAPRFYNAAVTHFNTVAGLNPIPAVRLWRG